MNRLRLFTAVLVFIGCRSTAPLTLPEEDARKVDSHVRRISELNPQLDGRERALLEEWTSRLITALALWEKPGFLAALREVDSVDRYLAVLQDTTRKDWRGIVDSVLIAWELEDSGLERSVRRTRTLPSAPRFDFIVVPDSAAERDLDRVAEVCQSAWDTAVRGLGVRPHDFRAAPQDSRIAVYLPPSWRAFPERRTKGMGNTRATIRKTPAGPARPGTEWGVSVEITAVYHNAYSLLSVAHEIVHAVTFLALTDWSRFGPEIEVASDSDLKRMLRDAIPPMLKVDFVHEGLANELASRVPLLRRALLLDRIEASVLARAPDLPPLEDLKEDPYSPLSQSFFRYAIDRFGGEKFRKFLRSQAPDIDAAFRDAFGEDLASIDKAWRNSLTK